MVVGSRGGGRNYRGGGGGPMEDQELDPEVKAEVKRKLIDFRSSDRAEIAFPAGERHERRFVHTQATIMGLVSRSQGRGEFRHCVVTRRKPKNLLTAVHSNDAEPIKLTTGQKNAISFYMDKYPINDESVDDHVQVANEFKNSGSNLMQTKSSHRNLSLVPPAPRPPPNIAKLRAELPATAFREQILRAIDINKVTLVTGGTGCGKTTQVPQFLLEWAHSNSTPLRVVCTQPRRLPAIAVAERVAHERGERIGTTVGYHIRLEQKTSPQTVLTYCTSGVLLRMLTQDELASDCTHIILDEIHEREQNTDYLLIALKQALHKRNDLKVILMSATMEGNLEMFLRYFESLNISHVDVPSRLHSVEKFFLSDVIALTGYAPPTSTFGCGLFSSSGFGSGFSSSFNNTSSFPMVDSWGETGGTSSAGGGDAFSSAGTWVNPDNSQQQQPQQPRSGGFGCQPAGGVRPTHSVASSLSTYSGQQQQQPPPDQFMNVAMQLANVHSRPPQRTPSMHAMQHQNSNGSSHGYYQYGPNQQWNSAEGGTDGVVDLPYTEEEESAEAMFHRMSGVAGQQAHPVSSGHLSQQFPSQPNMAAMNGESSGGWQQQQQHSIQNPQSHPTFYVPDYSSQQQPTGQGSSHSFGNHFLHRSTSVGGAMSDADSFGMKLREEESVAAQMRHRLKNVIQHREMAFSETAVQKLRTAGLDHSRIVNMYMSCGGRQWEDSVDIALAFETIQYLMDGSIEGAILVFLPGFEDIQTLRDKIHLQKWPAIQPVICLLHSQLNTADQQRVFESVRPGERKVILSTNIAEASLTIDDVVFVIDCGKAKEKCYDHTSRISQLKVVWVAKSNAEQRSGRAGRCRPGFCFRLYSREDHDRMLMTQVAEMQRSAIHDVCLHAKMFAPEKMSVKDFLEMAPEPPAGDAIESSLAFLEQLGALYSEVPRSTEYPNYPMHRKEPELTQLGRLIAHLPLEPQLARLLLFGYSLRCFSPVVTLVALLSHRDPFTLAGKEDKPASLAARDNFAGRDFSDHLMLLRAFNAYADLPNIKQQFFCRQNFISINTMKMVFGIRRQLLLELRRLRFVNDVDRALSDPILNEFSSHWPMVQAAIVAGCHPCIGFVKTGSKLRKIRTCTEGTAQLHPSTSLRRQLLPHEKRSEAMQRHGRADDPSIEFLAFQEHVKIDEGLTLRTVTAVPPATMILFAGPIRLPKETLNAFSIAGDSTTLDEETANEDGGFYMPRGEILELESWFSVRGHIADLSRLLQLRFKIMDYFLGVLQCPFNINDHKNRELLCVLAEVLQAEHSKQGYYPVSGVGIVQSPAALARDYDFGVASPSNSNTSHTEEDKGFGHANLGAAQAQPQPPPQPVVREERVKERGGGESSNSSQSDKRPKQYPDPYRSKTFIKEKNEKMSREQMESGGRRAEEREEYSSRQRREERGERNSGSNQTWGENSGGSSFNSGFKQSREQKNERGSGGSADRFYRAGPSSRRDKDEGNGRWRRDEDEQVPEDPVPARNGRGGYRGGGGGGWQDRRRNGGGFGRRGDYDDLVQRDIKVEEEEDWGKSMTASSFTYKGDKREDDQTTGRISFNNNKNKFRTFVRGGGGNRGFSRASFGNMRSDNMSSSNGKPRQGKGDREHVDNEDWG